VPRLTWEFIQQFSYLSIMKLFLELCYLDKCQLGALFIRFISETQMLTNDLEVSAKNSAIIPRG
jgi:hypothetical protein